MFLRCIAVAALILANAAAAAFDAKATFYSEDVLRSALADIGKMQEPELRAFTLYLAQCDDELVDVPTRHACSVAQTTYTIEFGGKRALDDLIVARSLLNELLSAKPEAPNVDLVLKHSKIIIALEHAARERFRSLKSDGK